MASRGKKNRSGTSQAFKELSPAGNAGFIGFGQATTHSSHDTSDLLGTSSSSSSLQTTLDDDGGLPDSFRVEFKQLRKKDEKTKLKALASVAKLMNTSSEKDILASLGSWCVCFRLLLDDHSWRVREAANKAFAPISKSDAKKSLVSHMKAFFPALFLSQFDRKRDVADAARAVVQGLFPSSARQLKALLFCKKEVFSRIQFTLNQSPQALTPGKDIPMQVVEERYEDLIAQCIGALAGALLTLCSHAAEIDSLREQVQQIASKTPKFWKMMTGKYGRIRQSMYRLVTVICDVDKNLSNILKKDMVPVVLQGFSDTDPLNHQHMFECFFRISKEFPTLFYDFPVKKYLHQHLLTFVGSACYGSEETSFPEILRVAHLLSSSQLMDVKFVKSFLESLLLSGSSALKSRYAISRCGPLLIHTFVENYQYLILRSVGIENESENGRQDEIQSVLRDDILQSYCRYLFTELSRMEQGECKMMQSHGISHLSVLLHHLHSISNLPDGSLREGSCTVSYFSTKVDIVARDAAELYESILEKLQLYLISTAYTSNGLVSLDSRLVVDILQLQKQKYFGEKVHLRGNDNDDQSGSGHGSCTCNHVHYPTNFSPPLTFDTEVEGVAVEEAGVQKRDDKWGVKLARALFLKSMQFLRGVGEEESAPSFIVQEWEEDQRKEKDEEKVHAGSAFFAFLLTKMDHIHMMRELCDCVSPEDVNAVAPLAMRLEFIRSIGLRTIDEVMAAGEQLQ